jgi:isopenicillin N synthase-like dioxygenase
MSTIPVLDLAGVRPGSTAFDSAVIQLRSACENVGFFAVTGHGVDPAVIAGAYRSASHFFAQPFAAKQLVGRPRPELNRGYVGRGEEALARLEGRGGPADVKEVYTVGPDAYPDDDYHTCEAARPHWGPNPWPAELPGFRPAVLAYWSAVEVLAARLVELIGAALGVDVPSLAPELASGPHQLRLIHYPPPAVPLQPGQLRAGAHTDLGMLTVLHSSSNADGGLEVATRDGHWQTAPDLDGFMVNIGDAMMRWTNDLWRSTRHRVSVPSGSSAGSRLSLAFFVIPHYDTVIECLPTCRSKQRPALYPPITMGEYRAARFASTATTNN